LNKEPIDRGVLDLGINHCPQVINYLNSIYDEDGVRREGKLAEAWRHDCEERLLEFSPYFFKAFAEKESVFAVIEARLSRKRKAIELINELLKLLEIRGEIPFDETELESAYERSTKYTSTILEHFLMRLGYRLQLLVGEKEEVVNYKNDFDTLGAEPDLTMEVASS
jgi:hypothetical protein